jgi:hypothetical protein
MTGLLHVQDCTCGFAWVGSVFRPGFCTRFSHTGPSRTFAPSVRATTMPSNTLEVREGKQQPRHRFSPQPASVGMGLRAIQQQQDGTIVRKTTSGGQLMARCLNPVSSSPSASPTSLCSISVAGREQSKRNCIGNSSSASGA